MSDVLLLVPADAARGLPPIQGGVLVPFTSTLDVVVSLKASPLPAVLCTDTIPFEEAESVAAAIRGHSAAVVEVRLGPWDGESHSPIGAACRGVISGFGLNGVVRAAEFLSEAHT